MGTMSMGYHYDRGKKIGYNISFKSQTLWEVSAKDKPRILREIKRNTNLTKEEIDIDRVKIEY